ncbi:adenylate cyclase isoform 1 [Schistosoma japonicum]|uniref:Adenylate cyclase isoform 1 n=1 Tax=Schistosoma japonicum TaxID=6182 RepID=A0A4Z2CRA7_SCHJA|nr:adenylate cyclase isoform 1 [Schistosoma japonicum]
MTDFRMKFLNFKLIVSLAIMAATLYTAIEVTLFTSDQYVFYSAITEQSLPFFTRNERRRYNNLSDVDKHKLNLAQKKSAILETASNSVRITLGLITTLVVGRLSDRFGRRTALAILLLGEILHIGTTSLIVMLNLNSWLVILAGFFEAVLGGGVSSITAQVAAFLVDICQMMTDTSQGENTSKTKQSRNKYMWIVFTVFDNIFTLCMSAGAPLSGFLIYHYGFSVAMGTALALLLPSIILLFCLPETHKNISRKKIEQIKQPAVGVKCNNQTADDSCCMPVELGKSLRNKITKGYQRLHSINPVLIMIMSLILLYFMAALVDKHYIAVYLMGPPFLWNPEVVGLYFGIIGVVGSFFSVVCTIALVKFDTIRKGNVEKHSINLTNRNHFTQQIKLLVTILALSLTMLIINRSLLGIAYQFQLPTANILIYIGMFSLKMFITTVSYIHLTSTYAVIIGSCYYVYLEPNIYFSDHIL